MHFAGIYRLCEIIIIFLNLFTGNEQLCEIQKFIKYHHESLYILVFHQIFRYNNVKSLKKTLILDCVFYFIIFSVKISIILLYFFIFLFIFFQ